MLRAATSLEASLLLCDKLFVLDLGGASLMYDLFKELSDCWRYGDSAYLTKLWEWCGLLREWNDSTPCVVLG